MIIFNIYTLLATVPKNIMKQQCENCYSSIVACNKILWLLMNVLSIFTSQLFLYLPEWCVFTRALAGLVLLSVLETGLEKEGKNHLSFFILFLSPLCPL